MVGLLHRFALMHEIFTNDTPQVRPPSRKRLPIQTFQRHSRDKKKQASLPTGIPPKPIALNLNKSTNLRHVCIHAIREYQEQVLRDSLGNVSAALLVDPAYHKNVGDHMITLGEQTILKRLAIQSITECNYVQAGPHIPSCDDVKQPNLPTAALWHGGGNWGDLWKSVHEKRTASFERLLTAGYIPIVTLPQSLYFQSNEYKQSNALETSYKVVKGLDQSTVTDNTTSSAPIVFTWREVASFEQAQALYPTVSHRLLPDSAFQLGPFEANTKAQNVDIVVLLRADHESTCDRSIAGIRDVLTNKLNSKASFVLVDWEDRNTIFDSRDILFTQTAIDLLSLGKIVVCDRLHTAILAYLSGMPFVYVDPVSGKITKTLGLAMQIAGKQEADCLDGVKGKWRHGKTLEGALWLAVDMLKESKG
jgi:exopolysaccharide biosynthesis predicted pyruvyltransferase EpsI